MKRTNAGNKPKRPPLNFIPINMAEDELYTFGMELSEDANEELFERNRGGHAWAVIAMENHSGDHYLGSGEKSNLPYYFVETTGHYDGSDIGINPWYDTDQEAFHEIT